MHLVFMLATAFFEADRVCWLHYTFETSEGVQATPAQTIPAVPEQGVMRSKS